MKHLPFESSYRPDFEVVEERQGHTRLYPHTAQLAPLHRALNLEFLTGLPPRLARVDHRADGFHKIMRWTAATVFCAGLNDTRTDDLRLFPLIGPDLVTRLSIVQQITTPTPLGPAHRFRFYGGADFFPEIYLSGRRLIFADHVLQRFCTRVPHHVGHDLAQFIITFYGTRGLGLPVGPGRALVLPYHGSLLAFTYKESADECLVTTCLSVNEINNLGLELPPQILDLHYHLPYAAPPRRHWLSLHLLRDLHRRWQAKAPLPAGPPLKNRHRWSVSASWIKDITEKGGHGPGSQFFFADHLPGPTGLLLLPGHQEQLWDELQGCKEAHPDEDWDAILADLEKRRHVLQRIVG